ncbi:uncharacterized protein FAM163A isoform X2 [Pan troglodytes]|uniref:uncharacterized protein FAM163A isoform X2 n=1 Tax=Pan troglodytes TaxID=9598 RepID=UPI00024D12FA|nr:protein FAM163A isoform X2 [Pan troglodytes]XP_054512333.1 protein FAM163A isoform X2 [Pan troglodytes]XP_054512334.1 protein FAM163A isoform X2 [Pan troglodytes]
MLAQSGATVVLSLQETPGAWPSRHLLLSGPLPQPRGSSRKTPPGPAQGCSHSWSSALRTSLQSLMGRRADDSGNGCDHWRNPSYGDPPLHHCRPVLLQAPVLLLQEERNRGCRRGGGAGARPSHASQRPHLQCLQLPSPGRQRQPGASHQRALQPALWGGREPLHYLLPIQLPLLHTDG